MSADNWTTCPQCNVTNAAHLAALQARADAAYGTVPVAKFDQLRADVDAFKNAEPQRTFREDYEFYGAEDGVVHASYSGSCKMCGTSVKFHTEHPIPLGRGGA